MFLTEEERNEYFIQHNMRCNIKQYQMLNDCANNDNDDDNDITKWNEWRQKNPDEEIILQGADLRGFFLEQVNFKKAQLQGATFNTVTNLCTILKNANFTKADCQVVDFRHTNCYGADFTDAKCENANFHGPTELQEANFEKTECQKAIFVEANCQNTNFGLAQCQEANFKKANCKDAKFIGTTLKRTIFLDAQLQGAHFDVAILENTFLTHCILDRKTDFTGTNLSSALIDPGRRALLERNIREIHWTKWYGETCWAKIKTAFMRFFWWLTDYGFSSKRILCFGFDMILLFAVIYTRFPSMLGTSCEKALQSPNFFQMLAFSTSTMVTLGFSNINVAITNLQPSYWGMFFVTLNLMMGYFILAVLVTRLGVLFQTLAPGYKIPEETDERDEKTNSENKSNTNQIIIGDIIWFFKLILYINALYCIEILFR